MPDYDCRACSYIPPWEYGETWRFLQKTQTRQAALHARKKERDREQVEGEKASRNTVGRSSSSTAADVAPAPVLDPDAIVPSEYVWDARAEIGFLASKYNEHPSLDKPGWYRSPFSGLYWKHSYSFRENAMFETLCDAQGEHTGAQGSLSVMNNVEGPGPLEKLRAIEKLLNQIWATYCDAYYSTGNYVSSVYLWEVPETPLNEDIWPESSGGNALLPTLAGGGGGAGRSSQFHQEGVFEGVYLVNRACR